MVIKMFYANAHADPKAKSNGYPLVDEWTLKNGVLHSRINEWQLRDTEYFLEKRRFNGYSS